MDAGRELSQSLGWDIVVFWVEGISETDEILG
jgi:hypothetical protein